VRLTLACRFAPCHVSAVLTAAVGRHARQTIGSSSAMLRAGARATIRIALKRAGRRLLTAHRRTPALVALSLVAGEAGARFVASVPVILAIA
jgi:hypothetical protein